MSEPISDNRRIAKNTVFLYARMLLSTLVSLYTSRVVLQVLGVEDYGVYGVVGGIVGMFSFLNSAMAGATSRFLTFELGRGDKDRLKATFSSAMIVHIGIALVIFLLADSVGLWFLHHKLVIPDGRMDAANWVLQCSIISMFFTVTQVPYNATIISHEKMDVYAYVEVLNVFLKLGIVYILTLGKFDRLKLYAVLMLSVSIVIALVYRVYCLRHYEESHFHWEGYKDILKPMLKFSFWDLFGHMSVVINNQGYPFAMNMISGIVLNAAINISNTVSGVIKGFAISVINAFRPPIIKCYVEGEISQMQSLIISSSRLSNFLLVILVLPCYFEADYILKLWLVNVPSDAASLLRTALVSLLFNISNQVINIPIHATGNIRYLSIYTGICYTISPFFFYFLCKSGLHHNIAYWTIVLFAVLALVLSLFVLKKQIKSISIKRIIKCSYLPFFFFFFVVFIILSIITSNIEPSIFRLFLSIISSTTIICTLSYFTLLDRHQRNNVYSSIKNKLIKNVRN